MFSVVCNPNSSSWIPKQNPVFLFFYSSTLWWHSLGVFNIYETTRKTRGRMEEVAEGSSIVYSFLDNYLPYLLLWLTYCLIIISLYSAVTQTWRLTHRSPPTRAHLWGARIPGLRTSLIHEFSFLLQPRGFKTFCTHWLAHSSSSANEETNEGFWPVNVQLMTQKAEAAGTSLRLFRPRRGSMSRGGGGVSCWLKEAWAEADTSVFRPASPPGSRHRLVPSYKGSDLSSQPACLLFLHGSL